MSKRILLIFFFFLTNGEYLFAQQSPHGAIKIPCINCHTTEGWKILANPMKFDHTTTGFSLQGSHSNVQCIQCHITKRFTGTTTDCLQCHTGDFTKALSPNHQLGKFSHDCLTCHAMAGWKPATFDHNKTNFRLTNAHAGVECSSCHIGGKFKALSTDCYSCHTIDFNKTTQPNHTIAKLSNDCLTCHTTVGWKPSIFVHNSMTKFQLVGAHFTTECNSCHATTKFVGLPTDCYTCHT